MQTMKHSRPRIFSPLRKSIHRDHRRGSIPSSVVAVTADTTQLMSDDIINIVATFGSCRDLCTLGQVCRRFSPLPFHDDLWEKRALDILPSVQDVRAAKTALGLSSSRELMEAFTRIGIPGGILGFWHIQPPPPAPVGGGCAAGTEHQQRQHLLARLLRSDLRHTAAADKEEEEQYRGELLRISLEAGGFLCESIAPTGSRRRIFAVRVSKSPAGQIRIGYFSLEKDSSLTIGGGDGGGWVPGDSMAEARERYTLAVPGSTERTPIRPAGARAFLLKRQDGRTRCYVRITAPSYPSSPPSIAAAAGTMDVVESLCGLWSAPYGSHGLEIIQITTDSSCCPYDRVATEAALADCSSSWAQSLAAGGKGVGSVSRMTDDSMSVCTSAPATDDGDGGNQAGDSMQGNSDAESEDCDDDEEDADGAVIHPSQPRRRKGRRIRGVRNQGGAANNEKNAAAASADATVDAYKGRRGGSGGGKDSSPPSKLFGFKVTGDENVPAGRTSFVIDLEAEFDVDEEIRSDSRPVVMFLPTGAVMANMANRREQIASWRKGRGQINRVPGHWAPEWVDVEFVSYQPGSRCAFSVVFRQPSQAVRVVMDFERALGGEDGWPRWSTATAAAVAGPNAESE